VLNPSKPIGIVKAEVFTSMPKQFGAHMPVAGKNMFGSQ
jgi:hypothetical protein